MSASPPPESLHLQLGPDEAHYEEEHTITTPPGHAEQMHSSFSSSSSTPITRTVAIIKHHALQHRFDIEPRIQAASFEIVKERQMEFDTETDPETLYELFGEDAESLAEGPVWVYVLERRRAVEVWNSLMGDPDPQVAQRDSPNSLRALYGTSLQQNALMGSPDTQTAEIQIASLFASSPPFPSTELPDDQYGSLRSVSESVLSALRRTTSDGGRSGVTNGSTVNESLSKHSPNGKGLFRARPMPATTVKPDIVPRMSRAAALRAGLAVDKSATGPRAPPTKERLAQTFANVPGHKRSGTISVASTAAPSIAPRMTRAASLRLGQKPEPPTARRRAMTTEDAEVKKKTTFEGVPGHKRRESIAVASSKAPSVAPRLNKSAALRAQKEQAPPSSFMFRTPSAPKIPGLSRQGSQDSLDGSRPPLSRPASQASAQPPSSRPAPPRASSVAALRPRPAPRPSTAPAPAPARGRPSLAPKSSSAANGTQPKPPASSTATPAAPAKLRPRPSSIGAPSIAPKTNRSAALRAAKKEAENAAAAAAAAKKGPRPSRAPPSSFKTIAT